MIDVVYTAGRDEAISALYLPRAESDNTVSSPPYLANVTETFFPATFPCQPNNYIPNPSQPDPPGVTLCCLPDFLRAYRVHSAFHAWASGIQETNLSSCDTEPPQSKLLYETDDAIVEGFNNPL